MNLKKMFQLQKDLDSHIENEHPRQEGEERFSKKVLSLLVELGELANEGRFFKYWSENQQPRTSAVRVPAMMEEDKEYYNPLLEEYVDGWHFIISLGLDLEVKEINVVPIKQDSLTDQFIGLFNAVSTLAFGFKQSYDHVVSAYFGLGEMLGFTWDQIEEAYISKNQINHQRQEEGY